MSPSLPTFYPVMPDTDWVELVLKAGAKLVQLRLKNTPPRKRETEIRRALTLAEQYKASLVINDYWQEAIEYGGRFIHLGQEDLAAADLAAIKSAGLRLGISTHDKQELRQALAAEPDYIALGPIWETRLKKMKWAPQGLQRVREWAELIYPLPLVAIGGITLERAPLVIEAGATSAAVVTDIITHPDPYQHAQNWIAALCPRVAS